MGAASTCSCGDVADHVVARRQTADGKHVLLWSDGALTWALGYAVRGSARPRTPEQRRLALAAGRLVLGEVCLYDAAEVPELVAAARWAAARGGLPGDVRARVRALRERRLGGGLRPSWTVYQSDRDGRPTVRVWRLPRLGWPGLVVWHERGRYEVLREDQGARGRGVLRDTGFRARTLRELLALLPPLRAADVDSRK